MYAEKPCELGLFISVVSRKGIGSQFTISILVGDIEAVEETTAMSDEAVVEYVVQEQADASDRILIVDDVEGNILVVSSLLEDLGISYEVASDGEKAVTAAIKNRYGMIFRMKWK